MPKILVNYTMNKDRTITIKDYGCIFADKPIAIAEFDYEYQNPTIQQGQYAFPFVVEMDDIIEQAKLKEFRLKINEDGSIIEASEEEHNLKIRLPHDTDLSELRFENNQLIKLKKESEN